MKVTPLWRCEDCGGPAWWTFLDGVAHYKCKRGCRGFTQLGLFDDRLDAEGSVAHVDRDGSVRAVDQAAKGRPIVLTKQQAMDLHRLLF